jgi:carotenoid cleavage dioxygenase-like enzyme
VATAEDFLAADMNADRSDCWIFAAQDLAAGPIAKVALPERIASGTHAYWNQVQSAEANASKL